MVRLKKYDDYSILDFDTEDEMKRYIKNNDPMYNYIWDFRLKVYKSAKSYQLDGLALIA